MIEDTLRELEKRIAAGSSMKPDIRNELLKLLATLRGEIGHLSKADPDQAKSITGFVELSMHEATRSEKKPQALEHALGGLSSTVSGIEEAHPQLVEIVNRISTLLANMGI